MNRAWTGSQYTVNSICAVRDYSTAIDNALAAQGLLAALADMNRGAGGGGSQGLKWDRTGIDAFVTAIRRQQNAAGGVLVVNNTYKSRMGIGDSIGSGW